MSKADNPFKNLELDEHTCFVCGREFNEDGSLEHVFPRWLQRKHNLWNQLIHLVNETTFRYSQIKVPCCSECNNEDLSRLENIISRAVNTGYDAVRELDELLIYQWVAKIYYGILRKEITLLHNRADKENDATILPKKWVEDLRTLHMFLQSIRRPIEFTNGNPFTVMVVNLHETEDEDSYWYRDNLMHMVCAIRSGVIGIIVALEDGGINDDSIKNYVRDFNGKKLHQIQFEELYARVVYQSSRLNRTLKFMTSVYVDNAQPMSVTMLNLSEFSNEPVVLRWDNFEYAQALYEIMHDRMQGLGLTLNDIYQESGEVMTWLTNREGKPHICGVDGIPV